MVGEPREITHAVKFFEKGERPLEIVTTRQWYLTNGGRGPELREAAMLLQPEPAGAEVALEVGSTCRICPRVDCPARREPSILRG